MKKPELLAPAGTMESLKAAIAAGCDAVYLGGYLFGARSFAGNFSDEELIEAVSYAHLYNVRVYVTTNTLVYEEEVETFLKYVDFLYHANVDALIIQDLGMMDLVRKIYPDFELHASTQMHIHNLEGVKMVGELGLKRAVIARETPVEIIEQIKKNVNIELEVFIHGALCVSYSGQCFMSSFIGGRSGNRGTCAQCCRQKYQLLKKKSGKLIPVTDETYLLSMRDLNTLEHIGELLEAGVDSLKIEGRMKRPEYVYFVVSLYRKAIDSYCNIGKLTINAQDIYALKKIFNRTFTKGFLFHEDPKNIINTYRPNHLGVEIGKVIATKKQEVSILLSDSVSIKDGIRIMGHQNDYGCNLNVFRKNGKIVKEAAKGDIITFEVKATIEKNSKVLKTTDAKQLEQIQKEIINFERKVKVKASCILKKGLPMVLSLKTKEAEITYQSAYLPDQAKTAATNRKRVLEQLQKLGDSCYELESFELEMEDNLFISIKELNELRRNAIEKLNEVRLKRTHLGKQKYEIELPDFPITKQKCLYVKSMESYQQSKDQNWDMIYAEEPLYSSLKNSNLVLKLPRVMNCYPSISTHVLIGEMGSLRNYSNFDTDFSFHVTNSYTLAFLHSMGAKKVTLSYELTDEQIRDLLTGYQNRYQKHPNVELIMAGYLEAMIMNYHFSTNYGKEKEWYLKDRFGNLYPVEEKKDYMIIYHHKKRNEIDEQKYYQMGVNSLRIEK